MTRGCTNPHTQTTMAAGPWFEPRGLLVDLLPSAPGPCGAVSFPPRLRLNPNG